MSRAASSRTQTSFSGRLLLVLYAAFAILLALFAFSVIRLPEAAINETDIQGTSYQGTRDAVSGDFVGPVEVSFASGARYLGVVEETGFSGQATYSGVDGWTLSGVFTDGYLEGEGTYQDTFGSYQGHFSRSVPDGKGSYHSEQGWFYEGDFSSGAVTGKGVLTLTDGSTLEGNFNSGVFQE